MDKKFITLTAVVRVIFYNVLVAVKDWDANQRKKQNYKKERSPTNMDEIKIGAEQEIYLVPEKEKIENTEEIA